MTIDKFYELTPEEHLLYSRSIGKTFVQAVYESFNNKDMENTIKIGEEVIDLNLPFPREMEVRMEGSNKWELRKVVCISPAGGKRKVIAIYGGSDTFSIYGDLSIWEFCREIPKKKQMTVAEIEAKLGHGVEVISKD